MAHPRFSQRRDAVSTAVLAGVVVIVIVVAALGAYLTLGSSPHTSSSTTTETSSSSPAQLTSTTQTSSSPSAASSSSSTSTTASSSSTTSTSSSTSSSNATSTSSAFSFPFVLGTIPDKMLMTANSSATYADVTFVPLPAASTGSETIKLSSVAPSGFAVAFFYKSLNLSTNAVGPGPAAPDGQTYTQVMVNASQSVAPGSYTVQIVAAYGANSTTYDLTVDVVKYLVVIPNNQDEFSPRNLTVGVGSTVYWLNLDTDNDYNVLFSSGSSAQSPAIEPFGVYSYTFTSAGTYSYYTTYVVSMTGTITVTANG